MILEDGEPIIIKGVFKAKREKSKFSTEPRGFLCVGYRLRGNTIFEYKNNKFTVREHSAVLIGNNTKYSQETNCDEIIAVHFDTVGGRKTDGIKLLSCGNAELFDSLFLKLFDIWERKNKGYRTQALSIFYEILYLTKAYDENYNKIPENIRKGTELIKLNFTDSFFSIKDAASASNVSEVYFRRIFKSHFNISPSKYISKLRISRACDLLRSGYYTVSEVAYMCGFSDQKYFSNRFKKETGYTPGKFKNESLS